MRKNRRQIENDSKVSINKNIYIYPDASLKLIYVCQILFINLLLKTQDILSLEITVSLGHLFQNVKKRFLNCTLNSASKACEIDICLHH